MRKDLALPDKLPDGFLFTDPSGLTAAQAEEAIQAGYANRMADPDRRPLSRILVRHLFTFFNLLNFSLAACLLLVGSYRNMLFISVIIANILIGAIQEYRAQKTISELKLLNTPSVHVLRDGKEITLSPDKTVRGDLVILRGGDQVVADAIVIDGTGAAMESLLTGESRAIHKQTNSWLYSGSYIAEGRLTAQLVYVGDESYAGRLTAEARKSARPASRLMTDLNRLIRFDSMVLVPLGILLFLKQVLIGHVPVAEAVPSSVAAMIGMIPEGLILLTSVAMAVGVIRLGRRKTLVQELSGIETLARADVLCLDKTGTITTGSMGLETVEGVEWTREEVENGVSRLLGVFDENSATLNALREKITPGTEKPRASLPFSSERKKSAATFYDGTALILGAPEFVLAEHYPAELKGHVEEIAAEGRRVLVLAEAQGLVTADTVPPVRKICGLLVLTDQLRPDVDRTLQYFRDQEVDIKIISGDNPLTVSMIARRAGLAAWDSYIDASTLTTEEDIDAACDRYTVFGRVTPEQKKELVLALKRKGRNVAMTGDGVNDIPALKAADCSIAMAGGADAAKNAAQLTLLTSDFSALPGIVLEGRRVINNITRTASLFLTKTIFSFLLSVLMLVLTSAYPFQPIQLTLISSLMIGLPGFVLALEPSGERIRGSFLRTVLFRALPGGIAAAYCATVAMAMTWNGWPRELCSTLATLTAGSVCWMVLLRTCRPFNTIREILLAVVAVAFIAAYLLLGGLFFLVSLTAPAIALCGGLVLLGCGVILLSGRLLQSKEAGK
ncbi:MAG: HAD-IC family P-type ATPase [Clostridiales bacterium]|nr:HAD-IC family P-type ATPase [Clostridiales bacterium]